jgi:hypothetical protein
MRSSEAGMEIDESLVQAENAASRSLRGEDRKGGTKFKCDR